MEEFAQLDALVYATSTTMLPSFYLFRLYLPECELFLFTHHYFVEVYRDTGPSNRFHAGTVSSVYATFADAACSLYDDAECMFDRTSSVLLLL